MREIKFRAWHEEKRVMKEVERLEWGDERGPCYLGSYYWKLMQYTGLKDKNGNPIYESDKLKDLEGNVGVVEFDDGCFIIRHENGTSDFIAARNYFEVTGNLYENPELLKN